MLHGIGIRSRALRYDDSPVVEEAVSELDALGGEAVWISDVGGDVLGAVERLLRPTSRIVVATGVLNVWKHDPVEIAARWRSWSDDWRDRCLMGLGISHA